MQILVITAFNIFGRNGDDWLVPRMRMFKEVCLPSVLAQTSKDFTWLILVDADIPYAYWAELRELAPDAVVQTVEKDSINQTYRGKSGGAVSMLAQPVNHMPRIAGPHLTGDWVATMALHVDDAISFDYVEKVHSVLRETPETIAFPQGALLMDAGEDPDKDGYWRVESEVFACVVVEPTATFQSVFHDGKGGGAHRYRDEKRLIETEEPMWLWHLHGILQNCNPNSNFRFVPKRTPYTCEDVRRRFHYAGPVSRFE
jgi:hypothetical protein